MSIDSRVVNLEELKLEHFAKGDKYESDTVRIGRIASGAFSDVVVACMAVTGHDGLRLAREHRPALILIDEWVAHARQLVGKDDLTAGTFEANMSFAQALTEGAMVLSAFMTSSSLAFDDPPDH